MAAFCLYNNDHIAQEPISLVSGSDFVPNITSINAKAGPFQNEEPISTLSCFSPFYVNTPFSHETILPTNPTFDSSQPSSLVFTPPDPPSNSCSISMDISNINMISGSTIKVEVEDEFKGKKHKKSNDDQGDQLRKHAKKKKLQVEKKLEKQENIVNVALAPQAQAAPYVHVRARRGQATDSHSLAERARRKKISQRMQHLESLVPGCDKINGKTLVLDEIINYILSLQNQVEFLAAKLASVYIGMELQSDSSCTIEKHFCTSLDPTLPPMPSMLQYSDHCFQFGSPTEILTTTSSDSLMLQKLPEKSTIFPILMEEEEDEDLQWNGLEDPKTKMHV